MQFYPSTITGREVASEQCEEAGDRNADAGGYFLNELCSLRTLSDRMDGLFFKIPSHGRHQLAFMAMPNFAQNGDGKK
jgi:hypothetical protein